MAYKQNNVIVDLSQLPKKKKNIDWDQCANVKIPITFRNINDYITIIDMHYDKKRKQRRFCIQYKDKIRWICHSDFVRGHFVKFIYNNNVITYNQKQYYPNYYIGDIITYSYKDDGPRSIYKVEDIYIKYHDQYNSYMVTYVLKCTKCGAIIHRAESAIRGCPCCDNQSTFYGINDITTTDPWMIKFFPGGFEEASNYTAGSLKSIYPRCPVCGKTSNKSIILNNLKKYKKIKCEYCSDNISYPERFMLSLLHICNVSTFIYQASQKDLDFDCDGRIYDFYFPEISCIVETHGLQHYIESGFALSLHEIQSNDQHKYNLAVKGGIKNYIVINCSNTSLESLKINIINSDLLPLLDIKDIDVNWEKCAEIASSNMLSQICNDYNDGLTFDELSKKYHMGHKGIRSALKRGAEIGICCYKAIQGGVLAPLDVFFNGRYIFSAICASNAASKINEQYNVCSNKNIINNRIRTGKSYCGFTFSRINDIKRAREVIYNAS